MIVGLTGGIGCGKSAVLAAFRKIGFCVIDADEIARTLRSAPETRAFVRERFGAGTLNSQTGEICAEALAQIVFADKAALAALEAFMHPRIRAEWQRRANDAQRAGTPVAVEVPLLFEKNYDADFDATVCVAVSENVQLERLEKRGLPRERALARIAAQMPLADKIRRANAVIFNDGSREFLEIQTRVLADALAAEAA